MIIEATQLLGLPVHTTTGEKVGSVSSCIFEANQVKLFGFQLATGVVKRYRGLAFDQILTINRENITIDQKQDVKTDLQAFDAVFNVTGPILGVKAVTESGKNLGRIFDVYLEAETGIIVRFYLKNLLAERIIPRQFLVRITPRQIVFKDAVDTPAFDQMVALEATPTV